jgi:hypothetical protein
MISVANISGDRQLLKLPGAVYIGRNFAGIPASPLANPFKVGSDGDRHQVCERYLEEVLNPALDIQTGHVWDELSRLAQRVLTGEKLTLCCWCEPQRCHGFDIAAAVDAIAFDLKKAIETLKPVAQWKEVIAINEMGRQVRAQCNHKVIPGLDADGCPTCGVWWVNQSMRDRLVPPRKKKAA